MAKLYNVKTYSVHTKTTHIENEMGTNEHIYKRDRDDDDVE